MGREIYVRHIKTGEIVRTIDVHDKSDAMVDRVVSGLLRNMSEDYYVDDSIPKKKVTTRKVKP